MTMRNALTYPDTRSDRENESIEKMSVPVQHIERSILAKAIRQPLEVAGEVAIALAVDDARPEAPSFPVIVARPISLHEEIKNKFLWIQPPKEVHQPSLYATAIQFSEGMKYTERRHQPAALLRDR